MTLSKGEKTICHSQVFDDYVLDVKKNKNCVIGRDLIETGDKLKDKSEYMSVLQPSLPPDVNPTKADSSWRVRQRSPSPPAVYFLRMVFTPPVEFRDLQHLY